MGLADIISKIVNGRNKSAAPKKNIPVPTFETENGVLLKYNGHSEVVTIPPSVSVIGDSAFSENKTVNSVVLHEGILSIGALAFQNCSTLEKIQLPSSLIKIGRSAFRNCVLLREIAIPQSVAEMSIGAFENCESLVGMDIPPQIKVLEHALFRGCRALTQLTLPDGLTEIESNVFDGCVSLDGIIIPQSVVAIGLGAFQNCESITVISIPDGIVKLAKNAFLGCKGLKSAAIPDSISDIEEAAFKDCISLDNVVLPDRMDKISNSVFRGCKSLKSIAIPDSVRSIEYSAFKGCAALKEPSIPDSVLKIGKEAFSGCLCEADIPNFSPPVWSDADYAYDCDFEADEWGVIITRYRGSSSEVVIPHTLGGRPVTRIGRRAFYKNTEVVDIQLPESIFKIHHGAFSQCTALKSINIPHRVTRIERMTFENCTSLEEVTIPHRVREIEYGAFEGCTGLKRIFIPKRVESIDDRAFDKCSELREIKVERGSRHYCDIDGVLLTADGSELLMYPAAHESEEYNIPESVKEVSQVLFVGVKKLERIVLHEAVTHFYMGSVPVRERLTEVVIKGDTRIIRGYSYPRQFRLISLKHSAGEWNDKAIRLMIVLGFVNGALRGFEFDHDIAEQNRQYITVSKGELFSQLGEYDCIFRYMMNEKLIDLNDIRILLDMYRSNTELIAQLLDYRRRAFPDAAVDGFGGDMYSLD